MILLQFFGELGYNWNKRVWSNRGTNFRRSVLSVPQYTNHISVRLFVFVSISKNWPKMMRGSIGLFWQLHGIVDTDHFHLSVHEILLVNRTGIKNEDMSMSSMPCPNFLYTLNIGKFFHPQSWLEFFRVQMMIKNLIWKLKKEKKNFNNFFRLKCYVLVDKNRVVRRSTLTAGLF